MKHYQMLSLPDGAQFAAVTPELTEKTILPEMQKRHLAPRGKYGVLRVLSGAIQLVMEDDHLTFDADPEHPIVIPPERAHHVQLIGPVRFKVEFYNAPSSIPDFDIELPRPGEMYCGDKESNGK